MKLTITQPVGGHKVGDTITTTEGAGNYLINTGYAEAAAKPAGTKPAGNASIEEWTDYALAHGHAEEELKDLKRDDIKALFTE